MSNFQSLLDQIADSIAPARGKRYFDEVVVNLSRLLSADVVAVAELEESGSRLKMLAIADGGEIQEGFSFNVENTLFAEVLQQKVVQISSGVRTRYPHDNVLAVLGAECFSGVSLVDSSGRTRGVLFGAGRQGQCVDPIAMTILKLFGNLVARELERLKMQATLFENEVRFRSIVSTATDAIVTIDKFGKVETFNQGGERLFGYTASEVVGKNVSMLMPSPDKDRHDSYLANYLSSGKSKIIGAGREVTARHKNGVLFPVRLAVSEFQVKGEPMFSGIVHDLSELKESQNELLKEREEAMFSAKLASLGEMTRSIIHEIVNPLTVLKALTRKIGISASANDDQASIEQVDVMKRHLSRIEGIIRALRTFVHRDEGAKGVSEIDLEEIVFVCQEITKPTIMDAHIKVSWPNLESKVVHVEGNGVQLAHVLVNLINNSAFAVRDLSEKWIEVSLEERENHVELRVTDSGSGIPEETSDQIFKPFFTTKQSGTGVGLHLAKRVVEDHGGTIKVDRAHPNTSFLITLPKSQPGKIQSVA